ncbi:hypothetical protein HZS_2333, partial [Henneguya salminicola]
MADTIMMQNLQDLAHKLRIHSIEMTDVTSSGHPTSCSSMAEITSVLFFHVMKYNVSQPDHPSNDRFILSKGHAAPILYAAWSEAGLIPAEKLKTLRLLNSDLEGHPTPRLNFIDVATGSLGQGIAVAAGMAYDALYLDKSHYRVFCVLGDGECAEGSVWEAASFAGTYKLNNLVAIVDINEMGQSDYTPLRHDMQTYKSRWESFGFKAIIVNGQSIEELITAFKCAESTLDSPVVILAKTNKGAHFPKIEGILNWHGKSLGSESKLVRNHLMSLIKNQKITGADLITSAQTPILDLTPFSSYPAIKLSEAPTYRLGSVVATRMACGSALVKLGKDCPRVVVCDADVKNSTFTDKFKASFPERFVDCYIAEQQLVAVATALSTRHRHITFISTFAAFLSRAHDQLRMAAISYSKIKVIGTHCGCSIGEDGGSQMGLEDIAMFRCLPDSVVLYPSDAVSAERAVELAANCPTLVYLRMSRPAMETIYSCTEKFQIGVSKIVFQSSSDKILVVAAGVTLIESLKAAEMLKKKGKCVRVMDLFSVKPIDDCNLVKNATECNNIVLTIEDHYPEGGIGEAVSSSLSKKGKFQVHM